jgi:hypothetical protein
VVTAFSVAKPAYTWGEGKNLRTVIGVRDDGSIERSVVLIGNRLHDTDLGAKVAVFGTLRLIQHPPSTIGTQTYSGFTEIRIEESDTDCPRSPSSLPSQHALSPATLPRN